MLRFLRFASIATLLLSLTTSLASAQSAERVSLVIGGPSHVGLAIPLGARFTLRPDLAYDYNTIGGSVGDASNSELQFGIGLLHELSRDDRLRTYIVPRVAFFAFTGDSPVDIEQYLVSLSAGAHGAITDRFGIFAEVGPGLEYSERTTSAPFPGTAVLRSWSIRSGIGATVRF